MSQAEAPIPILRTKLAAARAARRSSQTDSSARKAPLRVQSASSARRPPQSPVMQGTSSSKPVSSRLAAADTEKATRKARPRPQTPHRRRTSEDDSDELNVQLVRDQAREQSRTEYRPRSTREQVIRSSGQVMAQRRAQSASSTGSKAQSRSMAVWGSDAQSRQPGSLSIKPKKVSRSVEIALGPKPSCICAENTIVAMIPTYCYQ